MFKMAVVKIAFVIFALAIIDSLASPGTHHHVHHRIHVPTKIKTIYHTKIIKVPEHHHYIHEKEKPKLVKVPEHHHYFHEKEKEPIEDLHGFQKDNQFDFQDFENEHKDFDFGSSEHHNVYKKKRNSNRRRKHVSKKRN